MFRPLSDSWMLARCVAARSGGAAVLDLCTGSGAVALAAALAGAREVTAVDLSRRAALTVALNARLNGARVRALCGDLFGPVRGRSFDVVAANPPYLPSAAPGLPSRGPGRATEGGLDGRTVLDRICAQVRDHLVPGGSVLLVQSSLCGERATLRALASAGLHAEVVERRRGPLGPRLSRRAAMLEARGLLAAGVREEDVLVVCGRRPLSG